MDLKIKDYKMEKDKKSGAILIEDKKSGRCCWYDVWNIDNEQGYDLDFNQYIFSTDNLKDIEAMDFQKELLNYTEEVNQLIDELFYNLKIFY